MSSDEEQTHRAFKVQDRRRFSASGETRDEEPQAPPEATPEPTHEAPPTAAAGEPSASAPAEITFPTFIISLSTQALAHLGEIPDPIERQTRVDLDAARQIIDILGMLSTKTRGNLDAGESALLENALYDLRMRYVARAHGR